MKKAINSKYARFVGDKEAFLNQSELTILARVDLANEFLHYLSSTGACNLKRKARGPWFYLGEKGLKYSDHYTGALFTQTHKEIINWKGKQTFTGGGTLQNMIRVISMWVVYGIPTIRNFSRLSGYDQVELTNKAIEVGLLQKEQRFMFYLQGWMTEDLIKKWVNLNEIESYLIVIPRWNKDKPLWLDEDFFIYAYAAEMKKHLGE